MGEVAASAKLTRIDWIKIAGTLVVAGAFPAIIAVDAPSTSRWSAGWFLIAIGAMNVIGCRSIARNVSRQAQKMRWMAGEFWQRLGVAGIARLYFSLGIIFCGGGSILLSLSVLGS